ncbi:unnamed protein product [Protopolystoma xenopodis]|uniref:Uncharacterized protein n=1 Tax=Protopolystoma xenopodis TaxID=117903 RepID=A0A3S4ZK72_9PLAT|nr:unnamed protein product [Protopolystoma xenopodis]
MLSAAGLNSLPGHIQSVLLLNVLKLYCNLVNQLAKDVNFSDVIGQNPIVLSATSDSGDCSAGSKSAHINNIALSDEPSRSLNKSPTQSPIILNSPSGCITANALKPHILDTMASADKTTDITVQHVSTHDIISKPADLNSDLSTEHLVSCRLDETTARVLELTNLLIDKITLFVHSADLEVQERVSRSAESPSIHF